MLKKLRSLTPMTKWMLVVVLLLLIGIAIRWRHISREAGEAFRERFHVSTPATH